MWIFFLKQFSRLARSLSSTDFKFDWNWSFYFFRKYYNVNEKINETENIKNDLLDFQFLWFNIFLKIWDEYFFKWTTNVADVMYAILILPFNAKKLL